MFVVFADMARIVRDYTQACEQTAEKWNRWAATPEAQRILRKWRWQERYRRRYERRRHGLVRTK
jgi:hypothetical protein